VHIGGGFLLLRRDGVFFFVLPIAANQDRRTIQVFKRRTYAELDDVGDGGGAARDTRAVHRHVLSADDRTGPGRRHACRAIGAAGPAQAIVAGVVGAGATAVLHRSRFGRRTGPDAARDPSVNLDIGQPVAVPAWQTDTDGRCTSRVQYRGAQWDVEMAAGQACTPGPCTIVEIRGSRLIVAPLH
jgi:hypothetical protein